MSVNRQL